jgi:hypothetical protein
LILPSLVNHNLQTVERRSVSTGKQKVPGVLSPYRSTEEVQHLM